VDERSFLEDLVEGPHRLRARRGSRLSSAPDLPPVITVKPESASPRPVSRGI
jgi:hypothetical protein